MKRLLVMAAMAAAVMWVPPSARAMDLGVVSLDVGVPILYINSTPLVDLGERASLWAAITGNFRVGIEGDAVFDIVPAVFGAGVSAGLWGTFGAEPGTSGQAALIVDMPIRGVLRFDIEDIGYVQAHGGIILKNILNADTIPNFNVLRHIDVGVRVSFDDIGFEGGYLIEVTEIPDQDGILPSAEGPFYVGVYIPVL